MNTIWHCDVIKYLQEKDFVPNSVHTDMVTTLEYNTPTLSRAQKWAAEFKRERDILEDELRSGRRATASSEQNIDHVHHTVMDDRQLTLNLMRNAICISRERFENILPILAWVGRTKCLLINDQKCTKLTTSRENLILLEADPAVSF